MRHLFAVICCYFISVVYCSLDVFYIINLMFSFTLHSTLHVRFVVCLLKYLLTDVCLNSTRGHSTLTDICCQSTVYITFELYCEKLPTES